MEYFGVIKHLSRISQEIVFKKILESKAGGRIKVGRPRLRWQEDVVNDLRELKINK
jgi:hypothetical protein